MNLSDELFISALETRELTTVRKIEKSDVHIHGPMGGCIPYLSHLLKVELKPPPDLFDSIDDIDRWSASYIKPYCSTISGYLKRIEAAFINALSDGVRFVNMGFSLEEIDSFPNPIIFQRMIEKVKKKVDTENILVFWPELSLKWRQQFDNIEEKVVELLSLNWFESVDICGQDELFYPIENYRKVYELAKNHGLLLKAHVGEFGSVKCVEEACEELCLDQINHGLSVTQSKSLMKKLEVRDIQVNVCPTGNLKLKRIASYSMHPIRQLIDNGVPVTINSDDLLAFGQSVSQEYINLMGVVSAEELNLIRKRGIRQFEEE